VLVVLLVLVLLVLVLLLLLLLALVLALVLVVLPMLVLVLGFVVLCPLFGAAVSATCTRRGERWVAAGYAVPRMIVWRLGTGSHT
jgi:hypothetical protein